MAEYRTGKTLGTTIYRDGEEQPCAMAFNDKQLAAHIVLLLNCTQSRQIKELQGKLAVAEALADFSPSPCGHSSQYAYTEDGGKNIRCLLCVDAELQRAKKLADFVGPITPCPNCDGSGSNAHGDCCRIPGHEKECCCLICKWKNAFYRQTSELAQTKAGLQQATKERDELKSSNQLWASLMKDAKNKIERLREENKALKDYADTIRGEMVLLRDELDRVRRVIEEADHAEDCNSLNTFSCDRSASQECEWVIAPCMIHTPERFECDCWKSRVIAAMSQAGKSEGPKE